ncbi:MAG: hypothetical protein ACE5HB_02810 [Terriglobia bacterium]
MREEIVLTFFCLFVVLASLGVLVWGAVTGPLLSLDGLLLVSICLSVAALFAFFFLWMARDVGLWERLKRGRGAAVGANPDKSTSQEKTGAK